MSNAQHIHGLMNELGPLVDRIEVIQQEAENGWAIVCDDDTSIDIECDEVGNRLTFVVPLVPIAEENQTETYRMLLTYNLLWRENGGIHMAIDDENNALLLADIFHVDLTAEALVAVVESLIDATRGWNEVLENAADPDAGDDDAPEEHDNAVAV